MRLLNKFIISVVIVLWFLSSPGFTQVSSDRPVHNLERVNLVIDDVLDQFRDIVILKDREKTYNIILTDESQQSQFFLSALKQKFNPFNFVYNQESDTLARFFLPKVKIETEYLSVNQSNILGEKIVTRRVTVEADFEYSEPGLNQPETFKLTSTNKDEFALKDVELIQNQSLPFAYAELPQESFLSRILIPAGLIVVSVATVILFFIIRTK